MNKLKIVYISGSIIPSKSANSIHVMKMCHAFAELGNEVTLICYSANQNEINDDFIFYGIKCNFKIIKYSNLHFPGSMFLYSLFCLKKIKELKPDLLYGRDLFGLFGSIQSGIDTIYELHSPAPKTNGIKSKIYRFIFDHIINSKNLLFLVVISDSLKKIVVEQIKYKKLNIQVEHDCADEQINFEPIENWNYRMNALQIGYFGHLYNGRGIELILEIASKLPQHDFHLFGGNTNDIEFYKNIANFQNIYFHGFVAPADVFKYRNACDILISPYQNKVSVSGDPNSDTSRFMSPLKIFEYMSSKKPIICSDLSVLREVLSDENSILVNPENADDWIKSIEYLEDVNLRKSIAKKSYSDFINYYTWAKRVLRIQNNYFQEKNKII